MGFIEREVVTEDALLIDRWDSNEVPRFIPVTFLRELAPFPTVFPAKLLPSYSGSQIPACGNRHAGQGNKRIIVDSGTEDISSAYQEDDHLDMLLTNELPRLGKKVLVSAGHFMPDKSSGFRRVNMRSSAALSEGLSWLRHLRNDGVEADLLITVNDVTV